MVLPTAFLFAAVFARFALAGPFQCTQGSSIPYCVHQFSESPPQSTGWPLMIFMPGSGARGSLSNAASLATYDGHGRMINEYYGGNKDEAHTLAAEQFLTVVPISPDGTRHFWPDDIKGIIEAVSANYQVDSNRVHVSGYSMGSRGCWRMMVAYPELIASGACSAGAAEDNGASTLQQQAASAVFPLLKNLLNVPIHQYDGLSDETAGYADPEKTQAQIVALGGTKSTLTELQGATHSDMSIWPWSKSDLLSWSLSQSLSGSSSNSPSVGTTSSSPAKTSLAPTKASSPARTASVPSQPKATNVPAGDDDEDCDDEDGEDEEDCDDDEESGSDDDDEDCDDDDEASDDGSDDDCDEEDEGTDDDEEDCDDEEEAAPAKWQNPKNTKRGEPPIYSGRQAHHFVFSHSRRDFAARPVAHKRGWHPHRMISVVKRSNL